MTPNDRFLEAYRNLDTELKANSTTVLEYENTMPDGIDKEKLKICRLMRNYMSHNDTDFISTTIKQINFVEKFTEEIRKSAHCVKDEMKKIKTVRYTEPIKNIITQIDKTAVVPVESKAGIYLVDKDILIHQLAQGNKKIVVPAKLPKYNYLNKMARMDSVGKGIFIVTDNGTATGKYLGLLINE